MTPNFSRLDLNSPHFYRVQSRALIPAPWQFSRHEAHSSYLQWRFPLLSNSRAISSQEMDLENISVSHLSFRSTFTSSHSSREYPLAGNLLKCEGTMQNTLPPRLRRLRERALRLAIPSLMFLAALPVYAQSTGSDPWDNAVNVLKTAFTGTIATGLSLVAIVVGGLMFAYGEGQSKKTIAGIVFGVGMAIGAVNFMAWLFPG